MYVFVEKPAIDARVAFREVPEVKEEKEKPAETQMTNVDLKANISDNRILPAEVTS